MLFFLWDASFCTTDELINSWVCEDSRIESLFVVIRPDPAEISFRCVGFDFTDDMRESLKNGFDCCRVRLLACGDSECPI
jgi:hypothetical protein